MHIRRSVLAWTVVGICFLSSAARGQIGFIGANFTASTFGVDSNTIPPDTMGAAGVDHFVELINGRFSVYRKTDGVRVQTSTLNQFWTNAGASPTGGTIDPRVVYDPSARRYFAVTIDDPQNPNNILVAVSNSVNPTAGWTGFKIDSDSDDSNWADFPMIGHDAGSVYVSANMPTLGAAPTRTSFMVFPKHDLLAPTPSIANAFFVQDVALASTGGTPQLAIDMDGGFGMPILSNYNVPAGSIKRSSIDSFGSLNTAGGFISVAPANNPPTVPQPSPPPKANLHAGDTRFSSNTVLNNGELWAVQAIQSGANAALRWFRLNATTNAVIESGVIADPFAGLTFPSIAVNDFGDVVIGYTATGTFIFASAFAQVGKTVGGTTTFGSPLLMKLGTAGYERLDSQNRNRWGDYSATTVDPADPAIFWTTQEYASANDTWSTQATEIIVRQPNEARWDRPVPFADFGDPSFWLAGAPPTTTDKAVFSRPVVPGTPPGFGVVSLSTNRQTRGLSVRQGSLRFELNGNLWSMTEPLEVSPYGGSPIVELANGNIAATGLTLAASRSGEGFATLDNMNMNIAGEAAIGGNLSTAGGRAVLTIHGTSALTVSGTTRVWPAGEMHYNGGALRLGPLSVLGGAVRVGLTNPGDPSKTPRTTVLTMTGGGLIDLTNNFMIVDYTGPSQLPPVVVNLTSGYAGGAWTGPGINSSTAASGTTHAIGFAEASAVFTSFPAIFGGQSVDNSSIVLRYTRYGDANVDGVVNLNDFNILASNFGQAGKYWFEGDFDYDGLVNLQDFNRLAANFGLSAAGSTVTPAAWAALASAVPEPGTVAALVSLAGLAGRRRRRA
jgi:hypothetical protein